MLVSGIMQAHACLFMQYIEWSKMPFFQRVSIASMRSAVIYT